MKVARQLTFRKVQKLLQLAEGANKGVQVGIVRPTKYPGKNVTTADVALLNQIGHGNVPPRPFMSDSFRKNANHIAVIKSLTKKVVQGTLSLDDAISIIGEHAAEKLRQSIRDFSSPANAPSTIKRKGYNDPLVDTERMLEDVGYEVV